MRVKKGLKIKGTTSPGLVIKAKGERGSGYDTYEMLSLKFGLFRSFQWNPYRCSAATVRRPSWSSSLVALFPFNFSITNRFSELMSCRSLMCVFAITLSSSDIVVLIPIIRSCAFCLSLIFSAYVGVCVDNSSFMLIFNCLFLSPSQIKGSIILPSPDLGFERIAALIF